MDEEVLRLERALAEAPADAECARRLEAALLRAGRREEVLARYRAKYACAQENPGIGRDPRCAECGRAVVSLGTSPDLAGHQQRGEALALFPEEWSRVLDALLEDSEADVSESPPPLCLLQRGRFGLVISGLGVPARRAAAIEILQDLGLDAAEAADLCRSPVVPVLREVSEARAVAARDRFAAAQISVRVTQKRRRTSLG